MRFCQFFFHQKQKTFPIIHEQIACVSRGTSEEENLLGVLERKVLKSVSDDNRTEKSSCKSVPFEEK